MINKSPNQNAVSKSSCVVRVIAVFSPMSTHAVLKMPYTDGGGGGGNGNKTNVANGASPPPWLSGNATRTPSAAPVPKGVQQSPVVKVERAAKKQGGSDPDTGTAVSELSRAPECAV